MISSFLPPACPSCGSRATLVAGKSGLGCRNCTRPEATPEPVVSSVAPWRWPPRRRRRRLRLHRLPRISRGAPGQLPGQLQLHGRRRMRHLLAVRPPSDLRVAPLRRAPPAVSPRRRCGFESRQDWRPPHSPHLGIGAQRLGDKTESARAVVADGRSRPALRQRWPSPCRGDA